MKLKHLFIFLLTSLLLASCSDDDVVKQETETKGIYWGIQKNGTLVIYGKGKMQNYETYEGRTTVPWIKHVGIGVKKLVISDSITYIGNLAFAGLNSITELTIPNSVTEIGEEAFSGCYELKELTISNSLISIGDRAFIGCESLTELTIPSSITSIGNEAFLYCRKVEKITIPSSVTYIGDVAFNDGRSNNDIKFDEKPLNALKTIYSYCPMEVYSQSKNVFSFFENTNTTMFVKASDLEDYKAAQSTYWDPMGITISDTPAP